MITIETPFALRLVRNSAVLRGATLLGAFALLGCSPPKSSARAAEGATEQADASDGPLGSGHLHMTGDVTIDHDFAVDGCQIAPPGDGLLSGYHMNAKDGDSTVMNLSVVIKNYDKDGPYSPADKSAEAQVGQAMSTGSMGLLSLMVAQKGSPMPLAVMLQPTSTLVVTTADNGAKGGVVFTDMESPVSFADIDLNSNEKPHGKRVSGSISWTCGHVDQLNAEMNNAVNGMMNKLMPKR